MHSSAIARHRPCVGPGAVSQRSLSAHAAVGCQIDARQSSGACVPWPVHVRAPSIGQAVPPRVAASLSGPASSLASRRAATPLASGLLAPASCGLTAEPTGRIGVQPRQAITSQTHCARWDQKPLRRRARCAVSHTGKACVRIIVAILAAPSLVKPMFESRVVCARASKMAVDRLRHVRDRSPWSRVVGSARRLSVSGVW
jgi:hypothetical protein